MNDGIHFIELKRAITYVIDCTSKDKDSQKVKCFLDNNSEGCGSELKDVLG